MGGPSDPFPRGIRLGPGARRAAVGTGVLALVASAIYIAVSLDLGALGDTAGEAVRSPLGLLGALAAYTLAFAIRGAIWSRVLPGLSFGQSLAAIHVALAGNHLLPLRLGEPLRVVSVVRRAGVPAGAATASTVMLRAADFLAVVGIAVALGPHVADDVVGAGRWVLLGAAAALWIAGTIWLTSLGRRRGIAVRAAGPTVAAAAVVAWLLESAVLWQAASWAGIDLSPTEAALVTAVTIAAQAVAIAPGGLGTYEAAATASLVALGADPGAALAAALAAHALKTAYALVAGAIGLAHPSPGLLGRLRLPRALPPRPVSAVAPDPAAPVALVLPAHDEEATVADVVGRVPATVAGRPTLTIVVDDGSADGTAAAAAAAGAEVVAMGVNRGLGAAVRRGFAEAVARGAAVVAFCDADGEYAPEELERLAAPILAGEADYVVGSRFAGEIAWMRPHRRFGNRVLTRVLSLVARRR
ncbi:MAG: hypothetical protein QOD86_2032, partial [Miltoncostaeaceae bacterium]|nr:hypothetical protein [Miltoncostaeaceae bacterium]